MMTVSTRIRLLDEREQEVLMQPCRCSHVDRLGYHNLVRPERGHRQTGTIAARGRGQAERLCEAVREEGEATGVGGFYCDETVFQWLSELVSDHVRPIWIRTHLADRHSRPGRWMLLAR